MSLAESAAERGGAPQTLSARATEFARLLRSRGAGAGAREAADALGALAAVGADNPLSFRLALRAVFAKTRRELELFDELFPAFWLGERGSERSGAERSGSERSGASERERQDFKPPPRRNKSPFTTIADWLGEDFGGEESAEEETAPGYSPAEALVRKDFSRLREDEMDEFARLVSVIAKSLSLRLKRTSQAARKPKELDARRTLRRMLRSGGEALDLVGKRRKTSKLRLVALCDVSKSMDVYGEFLLQFLYAFQNSYRSVETFCFSTSLRRVTPFIRARGAGRGAREAFQAAARSMPEWSGGTRIGECLREFASEFAPKTLSRRSVALIVSDGWDTGDVETLSEAMREIRARAGAVVWLNPLAGNPRYEPTCAGMQAAAPHIDVFAPAHNLESLRALARRLAERGGKLRRRGKRSREVF